jgi:hypothetical protein
MNTKTELEEAMKVAEEARQSLYEREKARGTFDYQWTTDKPTKPGLYWTRNEDKEVKGVIRVYEHIAGVLVAELHGFKGDISIHKFYEFQGPINPFGGFTKS